jgi:hypothetical protein
VNTTPEHLNDLLVLLAVLMIEAGGRSVLALGMALVGSPAAREPLLFQQAGRPGRPAEAAAAGVRARVSDAARHCPGAAGRHCPVVGRSPGRRRSLAGCVATAAGSSASGD